ncbi:MAG: hypothetical protein ACRDP5_28305 [Streptosporangiaceae bacterium]
MKLIHLQTTIQVVFGAVDDDGNAIPQPPVTVQVRRFSAESFTEAYAAIAAERDNRQRLGDAAGQVPANGEPTGQAPAPEEVAG